MAGLRASECGDTEGKPTSGGVVVAHAGEMIGQGSDNWIMGGALPSGAHAVNVNVDDHAVIATIANGGWYLILPAGSKHIGDVSLELDACATFERLVMACATTACCHGVTHVRA